MAFMQVNFFSVSLRRKVNFNVIIPHNPLDESEKSTQNFDCPIKTLYLLHGSNGDYMDWLCNSRIQELSQKYNVAVIMPSGENNFYVDNPDKEEFFGEYVGHELVSYVRKTFHTSQEREDTWIGGLSMGGFGAIRNGLKYYKNFAKIIAFSSALMINKIADPTEIQNQMENHRYYVRVFGNLSNLAASDCNPVTLVKQLKAAKAMFPKIYMACGTEDFLIKENRDFRDFLITEKVPLTYVETAGQHDWDFWNKALEPSIVWASHLEQEKYQLP